MSSSTVPPSTRPPSPPVKLEQDSPLPSAPPRPEAIFLNCFPSLLPLLQDTAEEFCLKYLEPCPPSAIQQTLRGVSLTGEPIQRVRGIRELVAAAFYCQQYSVVRLKVKEFVRINQLSLKLFNRKYLAYQKALRKQQQEQEQEGGSGGSGGSGQRGRVKVEEGSCKSEHYSEKEQEVGEQEDYSTLQRLPPSPLRPCPITSPKEAIQLIFDGIFKSASFQQHRRETITKMSDRCQQLPPSVYAAMDWTESRPLRILYGVYGRLRQLGMSVGFTRYREAVAAAVGYQMKREWAGRAEKVVKAMVKEEAEGQEEGDESE